MSDKFLYAKDIMSIMENNDIIKIVRTKDYIPEIEKLGGKVLCVVKDFDINTILENVDGK